MGRYCHTMDHTPYAGMARSASGDRLAGWPEALGQDPDKIFVFEVARDLVRRGAAEWTDLGDGDIELHLASGEAFILGERHIRRIR